MKNNLVIAFVVILTVFSFSSVLASGDSSFETLSSDDAVVEKIIAVSVPSVTITASVFTVLPGNTATVYWSSVNTSYCVASGGTLGWAGSRSISGSFQSDSLYTSTIFTMTCYGVFGSSTTGSVTVLVSSPHVELEASPSTVNAGGSSIVYWSSTNATTCGASGGSNGWAGIKPLSGSFSTGMLYETTTYYISCGNNGQWHNATVTITVIPKIEEPVIVKDRGNKSLDFYGKLKVGAVVVNLIRFPSGRTFILPSVKSTNGNEWHINLWRGEVPFFFRLEGTPSMEIRIFDPSTARVTVLSSKMDF